MSPRDDTRRRRAAAVAAAAWAAMAFAIGIIWHVSDLRDTTFEDARRSLTMSATRTARMLDAWAASGEADARALAEVSGLDGGADGQTPGSTPMDRDVARRMLHVQMQAIQTRGNFAGVWMVDPHGELLASVGSHRMMTAAEDSAATLAMTTQHVEVVRPERPDNNASISIVRPIMKAVKDTNGVNGPEGDSTAVAAVVFRSDLSRAFGLGSASPAPRPEMTVVPVLVIPGDVGSAQFQPNRRPLVGITLCPGPSLSICFIAKTDTLARLASAVGESFGIVMVGGHRMVVATRRSVALPWSVYVADDESAVYAPMRDRLRFEALLLVGVLLVVGLALYARSRSRHLRQITERAQTEARFAAIVNTAMDAIVIVDQEYRIGVMNSAAEKMFGYAINDSAAGRRSVLDLLPEASTDEMRRAFERTVRADAPPNLFAAERYPTGRRRDGTTFPIHLSVSRTQIDGRPHLTIVIRDVTDWKRAEEHSEWQRRVLEEIATGVQLRSVLATIARFHETQCPGVVCAVHITDEDSVTLRASSAPSMHPDFVEAMDEIVIGPRAATCGTAVYRRELVTTSDIAHDPLWNDYRALAQEQGYAASWAIPMRSLQGHVLGALTMYVREMRLPTAAELRVSETATQLAGIAVDRAHAAQSLQQSEASFRSFVENSPIGIYRATGTGRLLAVNDSLVRLLGYDSAFDLLQVDMRRSLFVSTSDRERLLRQLEGHGELRSAEMEWRRKDGSTVTVRVSSRAYRDEHGSVWFAEGFVENITPLRVAEKALRQSEKLAALGQLVSGVAHELNNPLAAILHFAEDLLDDERTSGDLEALTVIRDQARRSRSIVRDLLSSVRFRDPSRERVNLGDALSASVRALNPIVEEAGAQLSIDLPTREIYGNTNRAGLQQIVTNLVVNAAQACGRPCHRDAGGKTFGRVHLRARVSDRELEFVVEDTGPGIPEKLMDRIFEPFFTTKPIGQGTGLGLSVTLGIIQELGGRISVENRTGNGQTGARFTVNLPIDGVVTAPTPARGTASAEPSPVPAASTASVASPAPTSAPVAATDGGPLPGVLIIDDEPTIRAALRRFFTRRGWRAEEAEDGAEGLARLLSDRTEFAAIICDLKMPGCSGVELHDHLEAVAPELLDRMVFSTGDVASRDAAEFVRRTRCTVMQKPFELRALEVVVNRMRQLTTA